MTRDAGWTTESPEDSMADSEADALLEQAGIGEPAARGSFLTAVVLPVMLGGVILLFAFWGMCAWLGLI
jgi:hypothetical protein